jgi:two-component system, sporulation sensor kinase A
MSARRTRITRDPRTTRGLPKDRWAFELALVPVVELDPEERIVHANGEACTLLGYEANDLVGRNWFDTCVSPKVRASERDRFQMLLERGDAGLAHHVSHLLTRAGRERIVSWQTTIIGDHEQIEGTISFGEDITTVRPTGAEPRASRGTLEDYKLALDEAAIVAITDEHGRITYANDRFCEISKYPRSELIGHDHRIINSGHHPKDFFRDLWATIKSGRVWRGDIKNRAKDGAFYWVATTIVPFLDAAGRPYQYVSIRHEITERKMAEAALLQAEKLSSVGVLAAGIAHELNNPLAGLLACTKALQEKALTDVRRDEYLRVVRNGLERMRKTIEGLLGYARRREPTQKVFAVSMLVSSCEQLIRPMAESKNLKLTTELDSSLAEIQGDAAALTQALMNLLLNAVHASPLGGEVTIATRVAEGRIGLSVRDRGHGMTEAVRVRACDPFFTTKPEGEGTGLGLSVTLGIARAHGGDLAIESAERSGTVATIWLPRISPSSDGVRHA